MIVRNTLLVLGLVAIAAVYTARLSDSPIYLVHDEVMFALHADSLARTGRALDGARLPLYFSDPSAEAGRDPLIIYMTAALLHVLPLSEFAVRLPTAIVGILDVVLVFFVAQRLFRRTAAAVLSALTIALAPAHFIHSRMALDVIYPIPFVLVWLWCLADFLETGRRKVLAAGMLALGAGVYSYLAAMLLVPIYVLITLAVLYRRREPVRTYAVAACAFAVPLVALVYWQVLHPARYAELLGTYHLFDAAPAGHVEGVKALGGLASLTGRLDTYWSFFNPGFLFFTGDSSIVNSTRLVGILLTPIAIWLAVGAWRAAREPREIPRLLLIGLLTAPAGVVLMGALEIRRAMVLLPFAALLAGYGADRLLQSPGRLVRAATLALVIVAVAQFGGFLRDYFGPYRERSAVWFGGNLRGAIAMAIAHDPAASPRPVLLSAAIPTVSDYWTLYARIDRRPDLVERASVFGTAGSGTGVPAAPEGALLVSRAASAEEAALEAAPSWSRLGVIDEPGGAPAFAVFEKR